MVSVCFDWLCARRTAVEGGVSCDGLRREDLFSPLWVVSCVLRLAAGAVEAEEDADEADRRVGIATAAACSCFRTEGVFAAANAGVSLGSVGAAGELAVDFFWRATRNGVTGIIFVTRKRSREALSSEIVIFYDIIKHMNE